MLKPGDRVRYIDGSDGEVYGTVKGIVPPDPDRVVYEVEWDDGEDNGEYTGGQLVEAETAAK